MHDSKSTRVETAEHSRVSPLWRRIVTSRFVWLALIICAGAFCSLRWLNHIGGPTVFREQYGHLAPLVTVPVMSLACVSPFPSDVIAIANGTLYGFVWGTFLSALSWWLAAQLQYVLGRQMRQEMNLDNQTRRLPAWLRKFPVGHPAYLILSRQIPWAGGHVSTLVPAAAGVSYRRYLWCSAVAVLPGSLLYAAIGVGLLAL